MASLYFLRNRCYRKICNSLSTEIIRMARMRININMVMELEKETLIPIGVANTVVTVRTFTSKLHNQNNETEPETVEKKKNGSAEKSQTLILKPSVNAKNIITKPAVAYKNRFNHLITSKQEEFMPSVEYERPLKFQAKKKNYNRVKRSVTAEMVMGKLGNARDYENRDLNDFEKINNKNRPHILPGIGKRQKQLKQQASNTVKRHSNDCFTELLFGLHPVSMALQSGRRQLHKLFVKESITKPQKMEVSAICDSAFEKNVPIEYISLKELDTMSNNRPNQGVCVSVSGMQYEDYQLPEESEIPSSPAIQPILWLVLDKIQDPMNFGAILRTAYFLGVNKVLAVSKESCALSPVVSKASSGVLEVMPISGIQDLPSLLQLFRSRDWDVLGTGTGSDEGEISPVSVSINNHELDNNTILILGNEGEGMADDIRHLCTHILSIPAGRLLPSGIDSLNVSVAAGILLHALCRRRLVSSQSPIMKGHRSPWDNGR